MAVLPAVQIIQKQYTAYGSAQSFIYMRKFKKVLRLLWLVIFIILGSVGVGLGGGVPIPLSGKKREVIEVQTEMPESDEEETKTAEFKIKQ